MQKIIQLTGDGSHTIGIPEMGVTYHSTHGAIAESMHVFIDAGLNYLLARDFTNINILEIGFGTGLNAVLTLKWAREKSIPINFTTIELDPLLPVEYTALNYADQLQLTHELLALHEAAWSVEVKIDELFSIEKEKINLLEFESSKKFDCVFFDAFSPVNQPELWTKAIFQKLYAMMQPNAVLLTYCSKSIVRKAMKEAGFEVTKIQGPWGKREMVRAIRLL